jgi:hypothetical protein
MEGEGMGRDEVVAAAAAAEVVSAWVLAGSERFALSKISRAFSFLFRSTSRLRLWCWGAWGAWGAWDGREQSRSRSRRSAGAEVTPMMSLTHYGEAPGSGRLASYDYDYPHSVSTIIAQRVQISAGSLNTRTSIIEGLSNLEEQSSG